MTQGRKLLVIGAVAALVLVATVATASASGAPRNQIKMFFLNTGVDPNYRGMVMYVANPAQSFFTIKLNQMDPNASYDVTLDGSVEETITTNSSGHGMI